MGDLQPLTAVFLVGIILYGLFMAVKFGRESAAAAVGMLCVVALALAFGAVLVVGGQ